MNVKEAYNSWSSSYDTDRNLTRDLDGIVMRKYFTGAMFVALIEAGCGTGKNTSFLSQIGKTVYSFDFSNEMIRIARKKVKSPNVHFCLADINQSWVIDESNVDLVTFNLILEHIENLSFVFSEAYQKLKQDGILYVSELHPYRQYQGVKANFQREEENHQIPAFIHHISDFINVAKECGFLLKEMNEWWHTEDINKPPRLISFIFSKP